MTSRTRILIGASAVLAAFAVYFVTHRDHTEQAVVERQGARPASAKPVETRNYSISSTATAAQTKLVAEAVDSLHDAYLAFFAKSLRIESKQRKLQLTLYKDRPEFRKNNRSAPRWAEAYYLPPTCYAYYADGERNPYHWMIHEATHQLNREVAHFKKVKWVDEGLATYFGTSTIRDNALIPGEVDVNTYPIWWLSSLSLTGVLRDDIDSGKLIPLRALISGVGGPDIAQHVNTYYIGYWSLTHFLFHFDKGRYADKYRQLIATGGSLEEFEKIIGPVDQIQVEWYAYLQQQTDAIIGDEVVFVIDSASVAPAK